MADQRVPESQVPDLILSGEFQFPKGQRVNVINPSGSVVSLPSEEIRDALQSGYKLETAFDGAVRKKVSEESGKTGAALKVFAGQAADEAAFGIPELAYDMTADPFDKAVKEGLKKEYELANDAGGVAGFIGSLFVGGPLFKAGAKAGAKASGLLAERLAESGVKRGSESLAKDILARTAENATRLGVEGAVVSAPRAITETALGDPYAAAESLMVGGGLGIGLGVLSGPAGAVFDRLGKMVKSRTMKGFEQEAATLGKAKNGERVTGEAAASDGSLIGDAAAEGADEGVISELKKKFGARKSNANEIIEASASLNVPVLDEQLAADKVIQDLGSAMAQRPTVSGFQRAKKYQQIYDGLDATVKKAVNVYDFEKSKFEVGQEVRDSIVGKAKEVKDKIGSVFNELRMGYADIPMDQKALGQVAGNIEKLAASQLSGPAEQILLRTAKQMREGRIQSLDSIKEIRTMLYDMYGADRSVNKAVGELVKKLNYQEEAQIDRAIRDRIKAASVPGEATLDDAVRIQGMYDDMQKAKGDWAEMAEYLEETGDALGLGHIKNPSDFFARAERLTNEQIVDRLIPRRDVETLRHFQTKFPEQFKAVADLQKASLLTDAIKDDRVQMGAFFRKLRGMSPEMQNALFGAEGTDLIRRAKTVYESLPANVNPSGTAKTQAIFQMLNPANIIGTAVGSAADFATSQAISKVMSVEGVMAAESRMADVARRLGKINNSIFKIQGKKSATKPLSIINLILGDDESDKAKAVQKLQDRVSAVIADPQGAVDQTAALTSSLAETGAPKIAGAFGQNLVRSLQYVYNSIPKRPGVSVPIYAPPYKPSDSELASFERKLGVVYDPFTAFDALQNGTLTKDHVEALSVNYPIIYASMRNKVMDLMTEEGVKVPYAQRLKLSLLMGLNLDQSVSPDVLASLQMGGAVQNMEQERADSKESSPLRSQGLMKLDQHKAMQTQTERILSKA